MNIFIADLLVVLTAIEEDPELTEAELLDLTPDYGYAGGES